MKIRLAIASSRAEVLRCQYLIAEVYNQEYNIFFSDDSYDLHGKVEPWPHRYLMATVGGEVAGCIGMYLRDTYVGRFGNVGDDEVRRAVVAAGGDAERWLPERKREPTKLAVHSNYRGFSLGRILLGACHSSAFRDTDGDGQSFLFVACAKQSIWRSQWGKIGIQSKVLKPFPIYKVHEDYASPSDPMESRVIIPDLHVPRAWLDLDVPADYDTEQVRRLR